MPELDIRLTIDDISFSANGEEETVIDVFDAFLEAALANRKGEELDEEVCEECGREL